MNIWVVSKDGSRAKMLRLRVVTSPSEKARGLAFVDRLPDDEGMLFLLGKLDRPAFWMKDVPIPLDLAWLGGPQSNGLVGLRVQSVVRGEPQSRAPLYPASPCVAVLEVAGGWFGRNGMGPGATLAAGW